MYVDHHYTYLNKVRYYLGTVTYPIHYLTYMPIRGWEWLYLQFQEQHTLEQENTQLRQQNITLNAKIQKFSTLLSENKRLKELFQTAEQQKNEKAIIAKMIATNYTPFRHHIILNKGNRDNVYVGQPILSAKGIMGQIISVTPFSSTGMLISDPSHSMLAQVGESGVRGLLVGTGNAKRLKLEYLPPDVDIKTGDAVITSGLDQRYPPDYPIGRVSHINRTKKDTFADIQITPFANLNHGREVLLTWPNVANKPKESAQ